MIPRWKRTCTRNDAPAPDRPCALAGAFSGPPPAPCKLRPRTGRTATLSKCTGSSASFVLLLIQLYPGTGYLRGTWVPVTGTAHTRVPACWCWYLSTGCLDTRYEYPGTRLLGFYLRVGHTIVPGTRYFLKFVAIQWYPGTRGMAYLQLYVRVGTELFPCISMQYKIVKVVGQYPGTAIVAFD